MALLLTCLLACRGDFDDSGVDSNNGSGETASSTTESESGDGDGDGDACGFAESWETNGPKENGWSTHGLFGGPEWARTDPNEVPAPSGDRVAYAVSWGVDERSIVEREVRIPSAGGELRFWFLEYDGFLDADLQLYVDGELTPLSSGPDWAEHLAPLKAGTYTIGWHLFGGSNGSGASLDAVEILCNEGGRSDAVPRAAAAPIGRTPMGQ